MMDETMTPEDFEKKMAAILSDPETFEDEEIIHVNMDYTMIHVLRSLGYGAGCDIFENTPKWYA